MKYSFIAGSKGRVALALIMLCGASSALALDAPAYSVTGSGFFGSDRPVTAGFKFTAESASDLSALGYHDEGLDGLFNAHDVGLYDLFGTLLASATVPGGTAGDLIGEYRYVSLSSPYTLTAGTEYVLAAHTTAGDGYRFGTVPPITLTVDPLISIGDDAGRYVYGPGLAFPTDFAGYDIYATPNMLLSPVPEPETYVLLLAGLGLIGFSLRNKKA
ncbi:DUF4082 domain-containing protein [Nitrosomonas oligotropha]|uniref:DUF4082 domain-containing protein n=1 Tax=Nitrosomonas oligotropha TaxID=42354 RepID=UPI001877D2B6|nr:DUF4082 domain-containing protein [Nitrosomonas oligotropha]